MSIHTSLCTNDEQWLAFSQFYLQHYKTMNAVLPVKQALYDLVTFRQDGVGITIFNDETMVGSILYRLDDDVLLMHSIMCVEQYRLTRVFYRGWCAVVDSVTVPITSVQFIAVATNAYTNRLYRKFARFTHTTIDDANEAHHHYEMSWDDFLATLRRMERPRR